MKPFDYGAILLALALTAAAALGAYAGPGERTGVRITGSGGTWVYPLDAAEQIRVPGPLGDTTVEIRGGAVRVLASPCANQLCVTAGSIHSRGQWVACLPNQVMAAVEGTSEGSSGDSLDAAAW
jgi:hypothetical protein